MLAVVLFASALASATIDFEIDATSARLAVERLAQETGQKLDVDVRLQSEIVIAQARGVSVEELMAKLAEVLRAEWRKDGTGTHLVRTPRIAQQLRDEEYATRLAWTEKVVAMHAKEIKPELTAVQRAQLLMDGLEKYHKAQQADPDEPGVGLPNVRPATTLLHELVVALGPKELAKIPPDLRPVIYAFQPTSRERALPERARSAMRSFSETRLALLSMAKQEGERKPWLYDMIRDPGNEPQGTPRVLLSIRNFGGSYIYWLSMYSKDGVEIATANDSKRQPRAYVAVKDAKLGAVELSPTSLALFGFIAPNTDVYPQSPALRRGQRMPDDLRALIAKPEERDPLSFNVQDTVVGLAQKKGKNLVACLSDGVIRDVRDLTRDGKVDLDSLVARFGKSLQESQGWLTLRPSSPLFWEANRLSRPALGTYLRASYAAGRMTLPNKARFHFQAGDALISSAIARVYDSLLENTGVTPITNWERNTHDFYSLIGSLTPTQMSRLESGAAIPLRSLQGKQVEQANSMLTYNLQREPKATAEEAPDQYLVLTELFPNGGFGDAELTLRQNRDYAIQEPFGEDGSQWMSSSLDSFAEGIAGAFIKRQPGPEDYPNSQSYRVGARNSLVFKVRAAPKVEAVFPIDYDDVAEKPIKFRDFPAPVMERLMRKIEQINSARLAKGDG